SARAELRGDAAALPAPHGRPCPGSRRAVPRCPGRTRPDRRRGRHHAVRARSGGGGPAASGGGGREPRRAVPQYAERPDARRAPRPAVRRALGSAAMPGPLEGRVAAVTGASSGIVEATAAALAAAGASVAIGALSAD